MLAIDQLDKIRTGYQADGSRQKLSENHWDLYESALQMCFYLHEQTQDKTFLTQAFAISEKSKALLLKDALRDSRAKQFAGIPDEILQQERDVKAQLISLEKKIFAEQEKGKAENQYAISAWQQQTFLLQETYDSLILMLETQYPAYYQLKYETSTPAMSDICQQLPRDASMLSYFVGDSSTFLFVLDRQQQSLHQIPNSHLLNQQVERLREGIYGYYVSTTNQDDHALQNQYQRYAHELYQQLIAPIQDQLKERLIIIPDGSLGYLPFEVLLSSTPSTEKPNERPSFLLEKHALSYAYSAILWQQMIQQRQQKKKRESGVLAFAPVFYGSASQTIADTRASLTPLKYNQQEAEQVIKLMGGKMISGEQATLERFLELAPEYSVLHISSHGKTHDLNPRLSFIAFYSPEDTIKTEQNAFHHTQGLFSYDLYNLELEAEMIVLSACETGLGKLLRGEGIASLARGFSYAGTQSILTSLWQVSDKATASLMEDFYRNLKAGQPKDIALQRAKMNMLNQGKPPFFWAAFISIGNPAPLSPEPGRNTWIWLLGLGILIGGFSFWRMHSRVRHVQAQS